MVALTAGWVSRSWGRLRPSRAKGRNTQPALKLDLESPAQPARVEVLENQDPNRDNVARPVVSFVLVNYAANWLPWLLVSRCTFLYHALGMMVFAVLGLAWLLARWLCDHRWHYRVAAWVIILLVLWGVCLLATRVDWLALIPRSPKAALVVKVLDLNLAQIQQWSLQRKLEPPRGLLSSSAEAQGNRAKALLDWAEDPTGPGSAEGLDLLSDYISLDDILVSRLGQSASSSTVPKPSLCAGLPFATGKNVWQIRHPPNSLRPGSDCPWCRKVER